MGLHADVFASPVNTFACCMKAWLVCLVDVASVPLRMSHGIVITDPYRRPALFGGVTGLHVSHGQI